MIKNNTVYTFTPAAAAVKQKSKKKVKIDLKNVSLGTSKINYIDPRISIAFIKKHDMEIDKIFTTALQEKFTWALDVDKDFKF